VECLIAKRFDKKMLRKILEGPQQKTASGGLSGKSTGPNSRELPKGRGMMITFKVLPIRKWFGFQDHLRN